MHAGLILLGAVLMAVGWPAIASPQLDGGCAAISRSSRTGALLVTDRGGKAFSGTMQDPLQDRLRQSGQLNQARYILGGSVILMAYRSGAIETFRAGATLAPIARLPAYSYMSLSLSRSGRWAVGMAPGSTSADVLDLSDGQIRVVRHVEHPLGVAFRIATIAETAPLLALLDEKGEAHLLDWQTGKWLALAGGGSDARLTGLKFVAQDVLWGTVDAGLMKIGSPLKIGSPASALEGIPMTRSATLIDTGLDNYLLSADDLGFTSLLKRQAPGGTEKYAELGAVQIMPGMREAVGDPALERIALCGSSLEVLELGTGSLVHRTHAQMRPNVFVDNITDDGALALVRDTEGRGAIWSVANENIVGMLPRLRLQMFPAFGALNPRSKVYLAFGQRDVMTIARPLTAQGADGVGSAYAVTALPLPFTSHDGEAWESSAVFAPDNDRAAYVARSERISRIGWSGIATFDFLSSFISAPVNSATCPAFGGRLAASNDGALLAVGCVDGVAIYDTHSARRVAFVAPPGWADSSARYKVWMSALAFAPDGQSLVFAVRRQRVFLDQQVDQSMAAHDHTVYVYKWRQQALMAMQTRSQVPVTAVRFSNDGQQVWVGGYWGDLGVYRAQDGAFLWRQGGLTGTALGIVFDQRGFAVVWTDANEIAKIDPANHAAVRTHWITAGGIAQTDRADTAARAPVGATLPIALAAPLAPGLFADPQPGKAVVIALKVSPLFESPMQAMLYIDERAVGMGTILGPAQAGVVRLSFPSEAFSTGSASVGLFSQQGGASGALPLLAVQSPAGTPRSGRLIGAFVGIGKYDNLQPLPLAPTDAAALALAFGRDAQSKSVSTAGERQTKQQVLQFLKAAIDGAGYGDTLVLGLSGHGSTVGDTEFYFATSDSGGSDTKATSGITPAELLALVAAGHQGSTLLILDTCESSGFIAGLMRHPLLADGPLSLGSTGSGLTANISVLAAAAQLRIAKEGYAGKGLLTGVILDGLKGPADANDDGTISQTELMNYVEFAMTRVSRKHFSTEAQDPVLHYGTADVALLKVRR